MNPPKITIEELSHVNPQYMEYPPGWTSGDAQRENTLLRVIAESVFGNVQWISDAGVTTSQGGCSVPAGIKLVPENEYIGVNLSKFGRLFTITYPWDIKSDYLDRFVTEMEAVGFRYVPFTLFADPDNYRWEYVDKFTKTRTPPPKGKHEMLHEGVWASLFGYL